MTKPVDWNNAHFLAWLLVPPGADVLDIGCGTGTVGAGLLRAGCSVVGVDSDKQRADVARDAGLDVVVADLEREDGLEPLTGREFDVVLCLDVLEHLREPGPVLHRVSQFARPTGVVIVSIPNMTHAAVRVALLEGRLERTEEGLLDRTHIGWYDRKAVEQLFATAGLEILERLSVRRELDETEIPVDLERLPNDVRNILQHDPDAAVYQFIYVACVDRSTVCWPEPHPTVALVEETQRYAEVIRSSTGYTRSLESQIRDAAVDRQRLLEAVSSAEAAVAERDRMCLEAQEELRLRMAELNEAHREATHFENELRFRDLHLVEVRRQAAEQDLHLAELRRQAAELEAMVTALKEAHAASCDAASAHAADAAQLRATLAEKNHQLGVEGAELQRLQTLEKDLMRMRASAGYRLADAVSASLRRHRLVYWTARALVRGITSQRGASAGNVPPNA